MPPAAPTPRLILYHYYYSPYAHKVSYYLSLRQIPFQQVPLPPTLPRPDLTLLGITYRRVPLLAIGNTVYADTSLILTELEQRFPDGALGGGDDATHWEHWSDRVFQSAVGCLPTSLPAMRDPRFQKDRGDFSGRSWDAKDVDDARGSALLGLEKGFKDTEKALGDGRNWVLGGADVSLADVNALWVLEWVMSLPGGLDGSNISATTYLLTFAWVKRFKQRMGRVERGQPIRGVEAKGIILTSPQEAVEAAGEGVGSLVKVVPVDTGRNHPQIGVLLRRDKERIVLDVLPTTETERTLRVVFPVRGYEIKDAMTGSKL